MPFKNEITPSSPDISNRCDNNGSHPFSFRITNLFQPSTKIDTMSQVIQNICYLFNFPSYHSDFGADFEGMIDSFLVQTT